MSIPNHGPRYKPATTSQLLAAQVCLSTLCSCRELAKEAGFSKRLINRIRLAISSAKGALRHAENRHLVTKSQ